MQIEMVRHKALEMMTLQMSKHVLSLMCKTADKTTKGLMCKTVG